MTDLTGGTNRRIKLLRPLQDFIHTEAASGLLLLAGVVAALVWANGPFSASYERLWNTELSLALGDYEFGFSLHHWVNDGLMAVFFFVVGLEIKRELHDGELADRRRAIAPICAAAGGMALPALVYLLFTAGTPGASGWGIPMATDIAIVLGVLSLLGSRVPASLKTFLLTLAIVDDIGAIVVIAIFYSGHSVHPGALALSVALLGIIWFARRRGIRHSAFYVVIALGVWLSIYAAGIHATLAGVALALVTPSRPFENPEYFDAERFADVSNYEAASETATLARGSISSVEWLQHLVHPWSSYLILPIFALANAGVVIDFGQLGETMTTPVAAGVFFALVFGKTVGVCLATWFAQTVLRAPLPSGLRFPVIAASSLLTGIGFTVSLFIADLAFTSPVHTDEAKIGVLLASTISGIAGCIALLVVSRRSLTGQKDDVDR